MKFKVASVDPDFLKVKLGETVAADTGTLSQTELLIEDPRKQSTREEIACQLPGRR